MSDYCDLDPPEFYQWREPVARKEHRCCECKATIRKGEKHFVATGKWDGELRSYRQHLLCCEACMFIRDKLNGGECICFGELWQWHHEYKRWDDRQHPDVQQFRKMLAQIKRRERQEAKR